MNSIRLWSFQSRSFIDAMNSEGLTTPDWQDLAPAIRLAYNWMATHLSSKTSYHSDAAPVWAWFRFENSTEPNLNTGRQLLSDDELSRGVMLVEFNAPVAIALLSCYETWNEFLDSVISTGEIPDNIGWMRMFSSETIQSSPTIQAVLPFIDPDWIVRTFEI